MLPQILACDVDPFDSNTSETNLIEYGNSSSLGITGSKARSAKAPCPISLLPGPFEGFASPTLYPGKLYWCIYLFSVSESSPSNSWASFFVPNVQIVKTWVWPLVNNPLPWTRGNTPTSADNGLTSSILLPSGLLCSVKIIFLTQAFSKSCTAAPMSKAFSVSASAPYISIARFFIPSATLSTLLFLISLSVFWTASYIAVSNFSQTAL